MLKYLAIGFVGYLIGKGKLNANFKSLDELLATNKELLDQLGAGENIVNG